jgi:hypothetical protein
MKKQAISNWAREIQQSSFPKNSPDHPQAGRGWQHPGLGATAMARPAKRLSPQNERISNNVVKRV